VKNGRISKSFIFKLGNYMQKRDNNKGIFWELREAFLLSFFLRMNNREEFQKVL